jgi:signal transduction histidine kinase
LAVLLARPDTDHVVPVLDGTELRAALAIGKPDAPITPADQLLVQDVANGAALLLRGVAQNAELSERVRRADDLATQLDDSRQRLSQAREVERRRLVMELSHATGDRLAALRAEVDRAHGALECRPEEAAAAHEALVRARGGLDELLDRFRVIARGVYPAVLRDQGPAAALDEVATDLPRPVRLTGSLGGRLDWEIESGLYYVAAAALHALAGRSTEGELVVAFGRADGRATVRIDDAAPDITPDRLRSALADDVERLVALGGDLELILPDGPERPLGMRAWVPDHLEPVVESGAVADPGVR